MLFNLPMKKISYALLAGGFVLFANNAALAASGHAKQAGLPQFDITTFPSQIFWLVVAFSLLYILFSSRVLPDISSVIEKRKKSIESDLLEAEKLQAEAEDVQLMYEKSLSDARDAATETLKQAEEASKKSADKKFSAFQLKAEKEMNAAIVRIEDAKRQIFKDIDDIAVDVVIASVQKLIGVTIDTKTARAAISAQTSSNRKAA
jgi:F-type H+-transporting ATPase subunit b